MNQTIDLGVETVEFLRQRMAENIGEDPQKIEKLKFNLKEVKEQIFRLFYDYQVVRGWPHVADNTADVLGVDRRTIYRIMEIRPQKSNVTKCHKYSF